MMTKKEMNALRVRCGCVGNINKKLLKEGYNTHVVTTLFAGHVALRTEKVDETQRGKAIGVVASFCPFCGVEYPSQKEPAKGSEAPKVKKPKKRTRA